ncbi:hypothetical protein P23_0439 [Acinetobacter calcoaceticus]|nr:hypothetical protein P23_0439 [Acinetobacter calcoaceticus]
MEYLLLGISKVADYVLPYLAFFTGQCLLLAKV